MKQKTLSAAIALSMLLTPLSATAVTVCSLEAMDTIAGLGTEVQANGCAPDTALSLTVTSPLGTATSFTLTTDATGKGTAILPSAATQTAGMYQVDAGGGHAGFEVLADMPDPSRSGLDVSRTSIRPDGIDGTDVILTLEDRYGNPLNGRPILLLSNRETDRIDAHATQTDDAGTISWTVRTSQPGTISLSAYDVLSAQLLGPRASISAGAGGVPMNTYTAAAITGREIGGEFGTIDHFAVQILDRTTVRANEDVTFRVTALDANENVVENYLGTILISSSDPNAVLPSGGQVQFRPAELGRKEFALGLRLRTSGMQTLTVSDRDNPSVRGTTTISVDHGSSGGGGIEILDPPSGARVGTPTILLQGKAPTLVNLRVKGGATDVSGESDAEGVFRIDVPLSPAQTDHTLFIVSDNGQYESRAHHIIFDPNAPLASTITFTPETGVAGETATISVGAEPKLKDVTASIGSQNVTLRETQSGTYVADFTAPAAANYDVKLTLTDQAGNPATVFAKWNVEGKGLPVVDNVRAQGRPNAIYVEWDEPADADVAQYRIYIGQSADNYEHSLDTGRAVNAALVNGLEPGRDYVIAVTAVSADGDESVEKSTPVTARPIGMNLNVTAGKESLLLEWDPPANLPLATYILEYGVDAGNLTEKRKINGELKVYTLRDLLNGVTYEVKLTPVAVTGDALTELTTVAHGTPNGTGFAAGSEDPAPFPFLDEDPLHGGAPLKPPVRVPDVGLPDFLFFGGLPLLILTTFFVLRYRRQRRLLAAFLATMDRQYHR